MSFTSAGYLLFLCAVVAVFWALGRRPNLQALVVVAASYCFYATWNVWYLGLLAYITVLQYCVGLRLAGEQDPKRRKWWLAVGVCGNLLVLAVFKYAGFAVANVNRLGEWAGLPLDLPAVALVLPLGISFYAFHTLSYTIDVFRGKIGAERHLGRFGLFVSFFPQLVAGPIVRAANFLPQTRTMKQWDDPRTGQACARILQGLFKKLILADLIGATFVDPVFASPADHSGILVWIAVYAYAVQIYNDFSGYSDIAIGSAQLMGFVLPENFDRPYMALNLQDFWRRWHISLSTWLRDYLYIPLGGSRHGARRTYTNLLITMLLGGLWHGANWTFVVWGCLHGLGLAVTRIVQRGAARDQEPPRRESTVLTWAKRLLTFHFVCLGWLIFRAASLREAWGLLGSMFRPGESLVDFLRGERPYEFAFVMLVCAYLSFAFPVSWKLKARRHFAGANAWVQGAVVAAVLAFIAVFKTAGTAFIYFQF